MTLQDWLSKRILYYCEKKKISVNKLALNSLLTQSTVDSIIQGKSRNPQLKTLIKIATGLGISVSELLKDIPSNIAD